MKFILLFSIFILGSYTMSAQCFDYQVELQNVDSFISGAIRNLKKAQKADSLEVAQNFIDKAISQIELSVEAANLVKEKAAACDCSDGINSGTNIYNAAFDCSKQAQKAVKSGSLENQKELIKKTLTIAQSVKDEISEGTSYCLE